MITIDSKQMMIEHYVELQRVTSQLIQLQMKDHILNISGSDLRIAALSKFELLIEGSLEGITFIYET